MTPAERKLLQVVADITSWRGGGPNEARLQEARKAFHAEYRDVCGASSALAEATCDLNAGHEGDHRDRRRHCCWTNHVWPTDYPLANALAPDEPLERVRSLIVSAMEVESRLRGIAIDSDAAYPQVPFQLGVLRGYLERALQALPTGPR